MKAIVRDGKLVGFVSDTAITADEHTYTPVHTAPPNVAAGEVAEHTWIVDDATKTVTQTWSVRQMTREERVPVEIPLWCFRAALRVNGLLDQAKTLIAGLPAPSNVVAMEQLEYGNFIERSHPLIDQLGAAMGLTTEQIDDLFVFAKSLS